MLLSVSLPRGDMGWSLVYDCDMSRPRGYKRIPCLTQLNTKFILLINVKMPTIVGILTFISRINTSSERLKQETS